MCGITGFLGGEFGFSDSDTLIASMCQKIHHRGPDAHGTWTDKNTQIALGHTRLSILDLSSAGAQPMSSPSGRYVIVFNGEIYNHLALRKELNTDVPWRGHSDTETLLGAFEAWGIEESICRTVGMFAFAVWDKKLRTLTLGRDRAGEKPLYYGWQKNVFLFASELKSLKIHPAFCSEINREAMSLYMRFNNVPAPYSIWKNIYKLMPGTLYTISLSDREGKLTHYWDPFKIVMEKKSQLYQGTRAEMLEELESLLTQSVGQQMVADVPVGAFLSGGVDSSLTVALMQRLTSHKVHTYSIGFEVKEYNEAGYAAEIAKHLKTAHTELYVSSQDAVGLITKLPTIYDEPFADSSQIPTIMVSNLARRDVTVALSGDAGDELFLGYNRYTAVRNAWRYISKIPLPIRQILSSKLGTVPAEFWSAFLNPINRCMPKNMRLANLGVKVKKALAMIPADSVMALYWRLISHYLDPAAILLNTEEPAFFLDISTRLSVLNDLEKIMFMDFVNYLPNDILTKVDRAAMSASLETRVPFLDHRVIEFAWRLPLDYKYFDNQTKWPLRQILYKYVPRKLIDRPKMGFGIPLDAWLRGSLREWAEGLFERSKLQESGFLNVDVMRRDWDDYLKCKMNVSAFSLWNVLMFQAWFEQQ